MMDRIPPQSLEYEQSILAGMLFDPEICEQAIEALKTEHFYRTDHKLIFGACRELFKTKKPVDHVTVVELLRERGETEKVTASYVASLPKEYPLAPNVPHYAEVIRNKHALRKALELGTRIVDSCYSTDGDVTAIINNIQTGIIEIETDIQASISYDPYDSLEAVLLDKREKDQSRDPDKPLGYDLAKFETLAKNIDGVQPGFYVIGADTNAGKTALLCNLTLDLLESNEDLAGIYFSLDDNKDVILNRFLAIATEIPLNQVQRPPRTDKHKKMLNDGYGRLSDLAKGGRLFIRDASEIADVGVMETEIKRRLNKNPKLFVSIDGLYNLDVGDTRGDTRKENIERATKLKALADTYRIPVICTGELVKSPERFIKNKKPTVADIMETGKFAYNANLVLMIYPDDWKDYNKRDEPILNLDYAKNKLSYYRRTDQIKFIRKTSTMKEYKS